MNDHAKIVAETAESFIAQDNSEATQEQRLRDAAGQIIQRLQKLADDTMGQRRNVEERWIQDLCQYHGVRNISEIAGSKVDQVTGTMNDAGDTRSRVFVNMTRPKTNRMIGRLFDILFPADDRNWGVQPTPQPDLDMVAKRAMAEAEKAAAEANRLSAGSDATSPSGLTEEELVDKAGQLGVQGADATKVLEEAKKRAERMGTVIDDQLVEARYAQKSRDAIEWAGKLGIGIVKGPVVMDGGRTAWTQASGAAGRSNAYTLQPSGERARPTVECVPPWAFFPDPSAQSMQDAEFVLERHLPSKTELKRMARKLGFNEGALRDLLKNGPGHTQGQDFQHLREMRALTGETTDISGRYVVWEYHGSLECEEIASLLRAQGTPEAIERAEDFEKDVDPFTEYRVIAYFCEGQLLKLTEYYPMDSGDFVYSVYSFEKGAASILAAVGMPRIIREPQTVLNAAWRMMMDNAKLAVGPQVLIDKSKVQPADGSWTMYPGKEWLWDSQNSDKDAKPFNTFDIPMNQEAIAGIIALSKAFIDDESAMPSIIEGGMSEEKAPGAASTMGGFAMMLNAAGVNVRRLVKNWDDDVTTGMIGRFYDWNMQHSEKDEIKGDMSVEARGTSVLLVREMQAQNLAAITATWTVHPVLGPMVKAYDLARLTVQSMSINPSDVLTEREDFEAKTKAMAEQKPPEDPQWAVRKEIAQIDAQSRENVAQMNLQGEVVRLSESSKISVAQIMADLEKTRIGTASKERLAAAEIAVEQDNLARAEAEGREPAGSGGNISLGTKAKAA